MRRGSKTVLERSEWILRADAHRRRVRDLLGGIFYDREVHDKHPIYNFIFNYYRFRPHRTIERYSPGLDFGLKNESDDDESLYLPSSKYLSMNDGCTEIDPVKSLNEKSVTRIRNLHTLLEIVQRRPPNFSCFGVHEFAMLYSGARHSYYQKNVLKLRMTQREIDSIVERAPITCTHFDATRHFPETIASRVKTSPSLRTKNEQAGCVHTNLDLFKYALRLFPFASSELVADALELAIRARELDMRASPYDLSSVDVTELRYDFDLTPILIETESGRTKFKNLTMDLYRDSLPIRDRIIKVASSILQIASLSSPSCRHLKFVSCVPCLMRSQERAEKARLLQVVSWSISALFPVH